LPTALFGELAFFFLKVLQIALEFLVQFLDVQEAGNMVHVRPIDGQDLESGPVHRPLHFHEGITPHDLGGEFQHRFLMG